MAEVIKETDAQWFSRFPKRVARIRLPAAGESEVEFLSLGPHAADRRRMLILRILAGPMKGKFTKLELVINDDKEVEDEDRILLPLVHEVMGRAARHWGIELPSGTMQ